MCYLQPKQLQNRTADRPKGDPAQYHQQHQPRRNPLEKISAPPKTWSSELRLRSPRGSAQPPPADPLPWIHRKSRTARRRGGVRNRKRISSQKGLPPAAAPATPASPPVKRRRKDVAGQAAAMPKRGNTSSLLEKVIYLTRMSGLEGLFSGAVAGLGCKQYQ